MVLAGGTLLLAPQTSAFLLRFVLGIALVASGGSELWSALRTKGNGRGSLIAWSLVSIGIGIALVAWQGIAIRTILLLGAVFFIVRGATVAYRALRARSGGQDWIFDLSRGLFQLALGVITVFVPESVALGVIVGGAVLTVAAGGIAFYVGQTKANDLEFDVDAATVSRLVLDWIDSRDVGDDRREEVGDGLFFEEPAKAHKLGSWWVMLLLSVTIATYGVMQDSTAVVIGAMLIAPLMTPILGTAAAIVNVWEERILRSLVLVAAGVTASIGLAFVIGQWLPSIVPLATNSQVLSRVSPNLLDMMIALAAGAAGAYANVDKRVSGSIAGVAIAVALVPPLGVVGLTLQAGAYSDALGAFLLFLTNLVSIILAATMVFFLIGYAPLERLRDSRQEITLVLRTVAFAALVILVPLVFTAEGVLSTAGRQNAAQEAVADWIGEESSLRALRINVDGTEVEVFLTGAGELPSIEELEASMTEEFGTDTTIRVEFAATSIVTYSNESGLDIQQPQVGEN